MKVSNTYMDLLNKTEYSDEVWSNENHMKKTIVFPSKMTM